LDVVLTLDGESVFNCMIKMLIGSSLPFSFGCLVCRVSILRWSSIYWWKQTRGIIVVIREEATLQLSFSWNILRATACVFVSLLYARVPAYFLW